MDRNEAKKIAPVLAAFAEGQCIECRWKDPVGGKTPDWVIHKPGDFFDYQQCEYRIKPSPREFYVGMQGHIPVHCGSDKKAVESHGYEVIKVREVIE